MKGLFCKNNRYPIHISINTMKKQVPCGFTLIELMIVVAILGILASIAIPAYSNYTAKAKFAAGLNEIAGYKSSLEALSNENTPINDTDDLSIPSAATTNCDIEVSSSSISCKLNNAPTQLNGITITLTRTMVGHWQCASNLTADKKAKYAPKSCQN